MTTTSAAESDDSRDLEHLACAAPFVFLLVAAADGSIDKKELKRFSQIMAQEEYRILAAVMSQAGLSFEQLLAACKERLQDPVNELMALGQVSEQRRPADTAIQFKAALLKLGHAIAQASGGFLGFGKKIDKHEAAMLALIVAAFSLSGGSEGGLQAAPANTPEGVLNDELFPALKPPEWVVGARDHVVMQSLYLSDDIKDNEPVIGYVHDNPQTVAFVSADSIGDELSLADIHQHAMANLERRLDSAQWEELSFNAGVEGLGTINGLVLTGDYFSSEAILAESLMKKAHQQLNSAMLMAIVPQRGELFVTNLISEENPERERIIFAEFAIKKFFNPEQAPISPNVFIIRNGKIVGNIGGMEQIIAEARKMAENEQQQEDTLLEHRGQLTGTEDEAALEILVKAHCVETMFKNLQHVIRDYVQSVTQQAHFNGNVNVLVVVDDSTVSNNDHEQVSGELGIMCQFLTDQFASLHIEASKGSPVTVGYQVEVAAAA